MHSYDHAATIDAIERHVVATVRDAGVFVVHKWNQIDSQTMAIRFSIWHASFPCVILKEGYNNKQMSTLSKRKHQMEACLPNELTNIFQDVECSRRNTMVGFNHGAVHLFLGSCFLLSDLYKNKAK
tara:strand:+ start:514 stop:891 length:378 start_codon:yes stop_codon:yes gene_type:complete